MASLQVLPGSVQPQQQDELEDEGSSQQAVLAQLLPLISSLKEEAGRQAACAVAAC